ncbi:MAG: hypothetical protein WDN30_15690 [Pararobbsia sp.]
MADASTARAFFNRALPPPEDTVVSFDALLAFWSQPARALLRDRLGLNFRSAQRGARRQRAVRARLGRPRCARRARVPELVDGGADLARATRMARASHELPGGATGAIWREREVSSLARLADAVRGCAARRSMSRRYFALELRACWPERVHAAGLPWIDVVSAEIDRQPLVLDGRLALADFARPGGVSPCRADRARLSEHLAPPSRAVRDEAAGRAALDLLDRTGRALRVS